MGEDRVIIGIGGHAVALDVATGTELWRTKLKSSGVVLWQNKLKGLGLGLVTLPGTDGVAAAAVQGAQRSAAAAG